MEALNLQAVESMLTGESEPVDKIVDTIEGRNIALGDRKNMVFMSTNIVRGLIFQFNSLFFFFHRNQGRGKGMVIATGRRTEVGKISKSCQ